MYISCSARKSWQYHIKDWIDFQRSHAKIHSNFQFEYKDIDYAFGQVESSTTLWGGRIYDGINLTKIDIFIDETLDIFVFGDPTRHDSREDSMYAVSNIANIPMREVNLIFESVDNIDAYT